MFCLLAPIAWTTGTKGVLPAGPEFCCSLFSQEEEATVTLEPEAWRLKSEIVGLGLIRTWYRDTAWIEAD